MAVIQFAMDGSEIKSYDGCVIRTWEHNGPWDSDFFADCVNIETGKIDCVEYDTTRCGGCGSAKVDLTEANFRLYQRASYNRAIENALEFNRKNAMKVEVGKVVRVVKGRKVPIGTVGTVFWQKEVNYDRYGRWYKAQMRIGIKNEKGDVWWLNQENVVVDNAENNKKTPQQIIREVKNERSNTYQEFHKKYNW